MRVSIAPCIHEMQTLLQLEITRSIVAGGWPTFHATHNLGGPSFASFAKDGATASADLTSFPYAAGRTFITAFGH